VRRGRGPRVRRMVRLLRLPRAVWGVTLEALRELVTAYVQVRVRGWESYARTLGPPLPGDPTWEWSGDGAVVQDVVTAVERWSTLAPRQATCLVRAVAGHRMLARRGVTSAVVLGVRTDAQAALAAHGWLRVGEHVVIGARERPGHRPLAQFRTAQA
jgi:hypothetical protein